MKTPRAMMHLPTPRRKVSRGNGRARDHAEAHGRKAETKRLATPRVKRPTHRTERRALTAIQSAHNRRSVPSSASTYVPIWRASSRSHGDVLCARSVRVTEAPIGSTGVPVFGDVAVDSVRGGSEALFSAPGE